MTVVEFEAYTNRPENVDRLFELINGRMVEKVPTEEHGIIVGNILAPLRGFAKQHKLGRVSTEARHRLPNDDENALLPDVSFRAGLSTPVVRRGAIPTMPDLAVEVQSPGQSDDDMEEKAAYYLAHGSHMVWLMFPAKRLVGVHRPGQATETLNEGDVLTGYDVLPGFELPVIDVFDLD
jgi:Uma2 family endonuclease